MAAVIVGGAGVAVSAAAGCLVVCGAGDCRLAVAPPAPDVGVDAVLVTAPWPAPAVPDGAGLALSVWPAAPGACRLPDTAFLALAVRAEMAPRAFCEAGIEATEPAALLTLAPVLLTAPLPVLTAESVAFLAVPVAPGVDVPQPASKDAITAIDSAAATSSRSCTRFTPGR